MGRTEGGLVWAVRGMGMDAIGVEGWSGVLREWRMGKLRRYWDGG